MSDDEHGPRPSLRPTAPSTLAVVGLAGAALTVLFVARSYQHVPDLSWLNSLAVLALAALLAWMAWTTRRTLRPTERQMRAAEAGGRGPSGAPGRLQGPGHALQIARFAALGKAAAIAGAAFFGAYLGFTAWLAVKSSRLTAAAEDLPEAVLGTLACAALMAAALWLEHSCRIPPQDGERDEPTRP